MDSGVNFRNVCLYRYTVFKRCHGREVLLDKIEIDFKVDLKIRDYKNDVKRNVSLDIGKKLDNVLINKRDVQIFNCYAE